MNINCFERMLKIFDLSLQTENELADFARERCFTKTIVMGVDLSEILEEDTILFEWILKFFDYEKSKAEVLNSFDDLMRVFSGLIERRSLASIRQWNINHNNPDIYEHNFVPAKIGFNFLRQKEKEIIDTLMKDFKLTSFYSSTKKELIAVKNTDRVKTLDLNCATLNCFLNSSKDYEIYDMNELVSSVKNLLEGINHNHDHIGIRHDKSKICSRSSTMLLSLSKTLQDPAFFKDVYLDSKHFIFEE